MTRLAILWHMHQPYYEDLATGEHILPWVRLHAIKDYWGMPALLREFPNVRVTFNLVPSLLLQIQAFADDRARDRHLAVGLKPAEDLDPADRAFLIANGFHAPVERMIEPYPRYADLHARRRLPDSFTTDDLRDLQVLYKLAWMDPDMLSRDPRLVSLVEKREQYTEADKHALREIELEILQGVIPMYRELAATGRVELSTSPFHHPILPLLCDTDVHFRAHANSALPRQLFRRPGDAVEQLERAADQHRALFGSKPAGVWPSEGSVSDEVIQLLATLGCRWTATDEEILARSTQAPMSADALYRPYEVGPDDGTVSCLFRDHGLSDLIGFTYQSWDSEAAADDFVNKVREAGRRFSASPRAGRDGGEVATITVILDGENAWEHYPGGGRPFLRALYGRLQAASDIQTVTMSEAVAGTPRRLASIFPGSWINGDFYIWAGHPDDHRAWAQLAAARRAFDEHASAANPEERQRAWAELLIAEGSDWFWWYGDDHSSDQDREFDDLFRRHLRNAYHALGRTPPDELHVSNITTAPRLAVVRPHTLITPSVDGVWRFAEWVGAVPVSLDSRGGTMHRLGGILVRGLRVAVDRTTVYFLVEGRDLVAGLVAGEFALAVLVGHPIPWRLSLAPQRTDGPRWVADRVVEVALPFAALGAQAGDRVSLSLLIINPDGLVVEQQPAHQPFELAIPTRHLDALHWRV